MKKIAIVVGTRPEAIKLIPVYLELKSDQTFETVLISTGQHKEMLQQIFSFFQVTAEFNLDLMTANQSLAQITSLLFLHLDEVFKVVSPDLVIVQGDTTTAMAAAITAFYHRAKVAHIEAGLRSHDKMAPYPEEINRKLISQVVDIHFAPTKQAYENLRKEQLTNIHEVGNTVIDGLLLGKNKVDNALQSYKDKFSCLFLSKKKLILITAHRRESFGDGLNNICKAIRGLSISKHECEFVFPVHLNPNIVGPVHEILNNLPNVHLLSPLPYDEMIFLLSQAYIILTDSGGIQEEAPSLNVPFIVLRDVTERPEGLEAGCGLLGGTDTKQINDAFHKIYNDPVLYSKMSNAKNPYGDGQSTKRIIAILKEWL